MKVIAKKTRGERELACSPCETGNGVRYTINGFVIAVGSHVMPFAKRAKATAHKLRQV